MLLGESLAEFPQFETPKLIDLAKQISDVLKSAEDETVLTGCFQVLFGLSLRGDDVRKVVEGIGKDVISGLFQLPT
jgi:hypothetical protein